MNQVTMNILTTLGLLVILAASCLGDRVDGDRDARSFPKDFKFGTSSVAYQIEGAWNVSLKGPSIWDTFTHQEPSPIPDGSNGDDACKSYEFYERDIEMLKYLGVDFYRFSISWSRLLPDGFADTRASWEATAGPKYYNKLIDGLIKAGIEPHVVMYGYDLPQNLQDLGGWANPKVVGWFEDYATVLFDTFGDRVKTWYTFDGLNRIAVEGYALGTEAPGIASHGIAEYIVLKNMLLANARVWHLYDKTYRATQNGTVSIMLMANYAKAATNSTEDTQAAQDSMDFELGIYAHPIFSTDGGFPTNVIEKVTAKSKMQGYAESRLQQLSAKEIAYVRGTSDYFGFKYVYTKLWSARNYTYGETYDVPLIYDDLEAQSTGTEFELEGKDYPTGIRKALQYVQTNYNNPKIFIEMNSMIPSNNQTEKITYNKRYMNSILDAIDEDNITCMGYNAYSFMDQFMLECGYELQTGLFEVDFTDVQRTRKPRAIADWFKHTVAERALDESYQPKTPEETF